MSSSPSPAMEAIITPQSGALKPSRYLAWLTALVFCMYGWSLIRLLRVDWTVNTQYSYGWLVPGLAGLLFYGRWICRPASTRPQVSALYGCAMVLFLALLLPLRLVEEANPEWRMLYWAHALALVLLCLGIIYRQGGWPWVVHFSFPVLFLLVMVPWSTGLEQAIIQRLKLWLTSCTVEIVNPLGIPALQHGNIIEINRGLVGVDEACSGVRSLQTSLVVSLFLGEYYWLSKFRRIILLMSSIGLVVLTNLLRTIALVMIADHSGLPRMEQWHDFVANTVMGVSLAGLWLLALSLRFRTTTKPICQTHSPLPVVFTTRTVILLAAWWLVSEVVVEAWYRVRESHLVTHPTWTINWPLQAPQWTEMPVNERAKAMLRCTSDRGARWEDGAGNEWKVYFLRWAPGKNSAQLAHGHRPEICLGGAGMQQKEPPQREVFSVQGIELAFDHYLFESNQRLWHVFYCLWEDRSSPAGDLLAETGNMQSRWAAALAGKRHQGQQVLEVALSGPLTSTEGSESFRRGLDALIVRGRTPPP